MITEDYVSFETAKLLKEKGFNEICEMFYCKPHEGYLKNRKRDEWWNSDLRKDMTCTCPTIQMTMKWLREVHDIYVMIDKDFATEKGWHYVVVRKQDWADNIDYGLTQQESNSYTYEEAAEAAIKYCLENVI